MRHRSRTDRAFTLIEILTVVAIIGVLVGLLFPVIKSAMIKGEYTKAQSGIANLSTAFRAYYTEYGKWPITDTATFDTYIIDQKFVGLLQGANPAVAQNPTGFTTDPPSGNPVLIGGALLQGNPHGTHFLDFKASDLDAAGEYIDPWKKPYYVRFDVTYANTVPDPFTGNGTSQRTNLSAGFLVWSAGPDNVYDNNGDSVPGQPGISAANKDNVKSW